MAKDDLTLQLLRKKDFVDFCMAMRKEGVDYGLWGFFVIGFPGKKKVEELPKRVKFLFEKLKAKERAGLYPLKGAPQPPRQMPTRTETVKMLKKFTKRIKNNPV